MNHSDPRKNLNEYQWEQEIRRDERRISCYFRELCSCLDLPGEEEIILNQLMDQPDLVPSGVAAESLRNWLYGNDEEEEDEESSARRSRPGGDLLDGVDRLLTDWNALTARYIDGESYFDGVAIGVALGKLLTRLVDWLDTDPVEFHALHKTLGKRVLQDLNQAAARMRSLGDAAPKLRERIFHFTEALKLLRERVIAGNA